MPSPETGTNTSFLAASFYLADLHVVLSNLTHTKVALSGCEPRLVIDIYLREDTMMQEADMIIVGAGSSGCALAGRLGANHDRKVVLLEAGRGFKSVEEFPSEILDINSEGVESIGSPYNWSFYGSLPDERLYPVSRGRILGGCSSINGAYFIRGTPGDFNLWCQLGNTEWSYEKVLPVFRRLEHDWDFDSEFHGSNGPVPVQRDFSTRSHPMTASLFEAAGSLGFPEIVDKNVPGLPGIGLIPRNVVGGRRVNAAMSYLLSEPNQGNVEILGDHTVRNVIMRGARAVGVEVEHDQRIFPMFAEDIILSAGAIKSPQLLMLSGIGAAPELRKHGIKIVHHAPGVGRGIMDHLKVNVAYLPLATYPLGPFSVSRHSCLNFTAPGSPFAGDIEVTNQVGTEAETRETLTVGLHQPESRGEICLRSPDPGIPPIISYKNIASHDLSRMRGALGLVNELLATRPLADKITKITNGEDMTGLTSGEVDKWIRHNVRMVHTSGGCRMGREADEYAVVDQYCRVHGVDNLRVVDTSIMPSMVSHGTSATSLMIGEYGADLYGRA